MSLLLWSLLGCAAPVELVPVSGRVAWMRAEYTGTVLAKVEAEDVPVGVLRVQDLAEDGTFAFEDLPVGEVFLRVEVQVNGWECWNAVGPRPLDGAGLELELASYDECFEHREE